MRLLSFALLLAGSALAQGRFHGQWVASFKGTNICTIEIEESASGKIAGASKACRVSVDQNGDLIEAGPPDEAQEPQPFLNPKVDGDKLTYELPDDGGGEPMKFEFKLVGGSEADLRFIGAPIAIKPIHFERR